MGKSRFEPVTLLASTSFTVAETANSTSVRLLEGINASPGAPGCRAIAFVLDVTDADTNASDTFDVSVQTKLDGTNWLDVVHFTQILGNGSDTLRFVAKVVADLATAEFEIATALGAAAVRNLLGLEWRVKTVLVDGGGAGSPKFDISVVAIPQ